MTAAAIAIAESLLRLGIRAWETHKAANAAEVEGLSDDEVAAYIDDISIGNADDLIAQGAASAATG